MTKMLARPRRVSSRIAFRSCCCQGMRPRAIRKVTRPSPHGNARFVEDEFLCPVRLLTANLIDPITVFIDGELVDSVSFTEEPFNSGDYRSEGIDLSELPCGIHTVHTQVDNGELVATANAVDIKVIKREPGLSEGVSRDSARARGASITS